METILETLKQKSDDPDFVLADFLGLLQSVGEQLTDDAWRCAIAVILLIYHNVVSF